MTVPKYALIEYERRFVVAPGRCSHLDLTTAALISDVYIDGTRLRLRSVAAPDGRVVMKLAKKYSGDAMGRPMTNLYLDAAEFDVLGHLPGRRIRKRRTRVDDFAVDVFEDGLAGLILAEFEADAGAVRAAVAPVWTAAEVTDDARYEGGALCRWTTDDLAGHRKIYG